MAMQTIGDMITEHDKRLIEEAKQKSWEYIREEEAETEEGRRILHDMAINGYHRDEWRAGIL